MCNISELKCQKTQHWGSKGKEFEQLIAGALDFANDLQFEGSGYSEWQTVCVWDLGWVGLGTVGLDFVLQRPLDGLDWCHQNWWMLSKLRISPWFWLEYFQQVHNPVQLDLGLCERRLILMPPLVLNGVSSKQETWTFCLQMSSGTSNLERTCCRNMG